MTILVRAAAPADQPALRRLYLRARRGTFAWLPADGFALDDFDEHTRGESLLVAQAPREGIVGFISVWEPDCFLHHLYVAGSRLREGIGSALLRALPGWPATRYRLKCLRLNERALAFYRAHGFVEIDSGVSEDGDYLLLELRPTGGR
ncbi:MULTISPECIES: GNAT family N-acetyltransferase [Burkholderia]|uniref:GNAT family N-acetyltransferase n=1 Tax=Burkholderia TaxID=32008 RepID=UPI000530E838|nr:MULTISPECIES: GNAT family N-acetyltransferase [Burkholderia]AOJ70124.1 acetyltransferase [Burkholderia savannae]AOK48243.1 acetyltransferase [Burkholderia sp. MSMB617WGS]KGR98574.1 acetyltransferase domain protein [Burkholderia sp. ABCPW 111]KVG42788.1 acetyltransferase [Burkholderia sp. MSMB0265]KVG78441.1 acetyltransferase [Burkholderia sp. MSMB2040]